MTEVKTQFFNPQSAVRSPQSAVRNPQFLTFLLCLACLLTFAFISRAHPFGTYSTETDFYHYFAPDAERLAAGQFPESPYLGPGYALVLALVTKLTGDVFVAGKWISIVGITLVVWLTFVLFARLFSEWIGLGAALLLVISKEIPQFAISATTDIFFLVLALASLVAMTSEKLSVNARIVVTALLAGFAFVTRYNALFLVAACLCAIVFFNLFEKSLTERIRLAAIFMAVFFLTASPWLVANWRHNGSPLHNKNYLNMATLFYPELAGGEVGQDGTRVLDERFSSFGEVLRYDPARLLKQYPVKLFENLKQSLSGDLVSVWMGWLAMLGIVLALLERRSKAVLLVLSAGAFYFALMTLNHWETRYYFFIAALYAGLSVYAAARLLEIARQRGWLQSQVFVVIPLALFAVMLVTSVRASRNNLNEFLSSHPQEVIAARDYLQRLNVAPHSLRIVARKPHIPFLTKQDWIFFPPVKSTDELRVWLEKNRVDYLVFGARELKERKKLKDLKDPNKAPAWLKAEWVSADPFCILYRPSLTPTSKSE